ncbi:MAG: TIM barrel protein, partial [Pseudomonadota bacterium]
MKLGILTAPFEDIELGDVAAWAGSEGFEALEVACWPPAGTDRRRYAGTSHIDVRDMTATRGSEIIGALADKGLTISGLGYYPNPLSPDAEAVEVAVSHLKTVISAAGTMGVGVVNTFVGGDRTKTVDQNWERATQVFDPIVAE